MKQDFIILQIAVLIACISAIDLNSNCVSVNSKSISTLEEDAPSHKHLSQANGRHRRSREIRNSGRFVSSTQQTVIDLKKTINEKEELLNFLNQSASTRDLDYKTQISTLQAEVSNLKRQLDNQNIENTQQLNELSQQVQRLSSQVNDLTTRILPYDTILDIENRRFGAAEEKMNKLNEESQIRRIILRVSRPENFNLLNEFQKTLQSTKFKLLVFENLALEIASTTDDNVDIGQVIDLLKSVKNKILDKSDVDADMKRRATTVSNSLRDSEKMHISTHLKDALFTGNHSASPNYDVAFLGDRELFIDSIRTTVRNFYDTVDFKLILNFVDGFKHYGQSIEGYAAIFFELKSRGQQYSEEMLELAGHISKKYVRSGSDEDKKTVEILKNEMPKYVSALAFSSDQVFITSKLYNSNLNTSYYGRMGRDEIGSWRFEKDDDHWKIKNNMHNVFLSFGATEEKFLERSFFNLTTKRESDIHTEWTIIPKSDGVYLMNKDSEFYLCSQEIWRIFSSNSIEFNVWSRRYGEKTRFSDHCTWEIRPKEQ